MRSNRGTGTKPELALRSALHAAGKRFRVNLAIPNLGIRVRPDIVFPRQRLCVFVDGCFWHRCPLHATEAKANAEFWRNKLQANVDRDRRAESILIRSGWEVLRIWEHESTEDAVARVIGRLKELEG